MSTFSSRIRFRLFQLLEKGVSWLKHQPPEAFSHRVPEQQAGPSASKEFCLWVFASTIGEVHAIQSFLVALLAQQKFSRLVILTDHPHYADAFLKAFPGAAIVDHGVTGKVELLMDRYPPKLFLLAEIPCLLADAPCRFAYRIVHHLKKHKIPVAIVNGWLYGEEPSCRMDAIESSWFQKDYLRAIDMFLVQTEDIQNSLLQSGVEPSKLFVTGNIKFDALKTDTSDQAVPEGLVPLLAAVSESSRPCIVAGCITNISEQEYVLDAFLAVLEVFPSALLLLAPRHPENQGRMRRLSELLEQRHLTYQLRSEFSAGDTVSTSVMVLDTMGELRHLYAASTVSFVGLNHNVLEPLALGKPVLVGSGWEPAYPSYPVYQETKRLGIIQESDNPGHLGKLLIHALKNKPSLSAEKNRHALESLCGATQADLKHIRALIKD